MSSACHRMSAERKQASSAVSKVIPSTQLNSYTAHSVRQRTIKPRKALLLLTSPVRTTQQHRHRGMVSAAADRQKTVRVWQARHERGGRNLARRCSYPSTPVDDHFETLRLPDVLARCLPRHNVRQYETCKVAPWQNRKPARAARNPRARNLFFLPDPPPPYHRPALRSR